MVKKMCVAKPCNAHSLLFIICFVTAGGQNVSARAGLGACQGAGFANKTSHQHKYLHVFPALGAFYFCQSGCPLAFLASVNQHYPHTPYFFKSTVPFFSKTMPSLSSRFLWASVPPKA